MQSCLRPLFHPKFDLIQKSDLCCPNIVSVTTLNMIFSVTYYLEVYNVIYVYCISHILPTNVELVLWTLQNDNNFTL